MAPSLPAVSALVAPQGSGHSAVAADSRARHELPKALARTSASGPGESINDVDSALPWLREAAREAGVDLTFRIEQDLQRVVVVVANRADGSVIRQIPSEEALRIARHLQKNGPAAGGLLAATA